MLQPVTWVGEREKKPPASLSATPLCFVVTVRIINLFTLVANTCCHFEMWRQDQAQLFPESASQSWPPGRADSAHKEPTLLSYQYVFLVLRAAWGKYSQAPCLSTKLNLSKLLVLPSCLEFGWEMRKYVICSLRACFELKRCQNKDPCLSVSCLMDEEKYQNRSRIYSLLILSYFQLLCNQQLLEPSIVSVYSLSASQYRRATAAVCSEHQYCWVYWNYWITAWSSDCSLEAKSQPQEHRRGQFSCVTGKSGAWLHLS